MRPVTKDELTHILDLHAKWLAGHMNGARADLSGADLRGADLRGADLRDADLTPIRDDIWAVLCSSPK